MIELYVERLEKLYRTRKRKVSAEIIRLAVDLLAAEREYGIAIETEPDLRDILKDEIQWRSKDNQLL
jgi:hypothetical protein